MTDENTRKLIKFYRRTKSPKAMEILLKNYQPAVIKTARMNPTNIITFEDQVQILNEFLIDLIKKKYDLRRKNKFLTYLMSKGRFYLIDQIRKIGKTKNHKPLVRISDVDHKITNNEMPGEDLEEKETRDYLIKVIQTLPREEQIIMGCLHQGMRQTEIAEQAGVSESRISQIYKKALEKIREQMRDQI